jgi:copper(I)-binding protein
MLRFTLTMALSLTMYLNADARDYMQGSLEIDHPWARATPDGAKNGAAYVTLKNNGKEPDTLISVQTNAADRAEVHEHVHEGGVMKMRPVSGGVSVPPGETVSFKPGGYHIMLLGLKQKLDDGKTLPLKLTFAKAGEVDVEVSIEKTGEPKASEHHDHMHMPMN